MGQPLPKRIHNSIRGSLWHSLIFWGKWNSRNLQWELLKQRMGIEDVKSPTHVVTVVKFKSLFWYFPKVGPFFLVPFHYSIRSFAGLGYTQSLHKLGFSSPSNTHQHNHYIFGRLTVAGRERIWAYRLFLSLYLSKFQCCDCFLVFVGCQCQLHFWRICGGQFYRMKHSGCLLDVFFSPSGGIVILLGVVWWSTFLSGVCWNVSSWTVHPPPPTTISNHHHRW